MFGKVCESSVCVYVIAQLVTREIGREGAVSYGGGKGTLALPGPMGEGWRGYE